MSNADDELRRQIADAVMRGDDDEADRLAAKLPRWSDPAPSASIGGDDPGGHIARAADRRAGFANVDKSVLAGWVCLLVYWAASAWLPLLGSFFGIPLVIAAFVLGIVAMTRGRVAAGVILVIVATGAVLVSCAMGLAGATGYGSM